MSGGVGNTGGYIELITDYAYKMGKRGVNLPSFSNWLALSG
jgi:hypothetical protein